MSKKLGLFFCAVAVMAFAIPSFANAAAITSSSGVLAKTGTVITGTGSDVTLTSVPLGAITCKKLTLKGTLTKNNGSEVEGSGAEETPPVEGCLNGSNVVDVEKVHVTALLATSTEKWASFTATVKITAANPVTCVFTGTKVPFTYTAGSDSITFTKAGPVTSTGGCGSSPLDGTFTIEIGSTPVILD
jgi:hypothetical protein